MKYNLKKVGIFDQKIIEVAGRIGPNLKKRKFKDSWTAESVLIFQKGCRDLRTVDLIRIFKEGF